MHIFLTGAASSLAQALLPRLCADPAVSHVCGLDTRDTPWQHAKYAHIRGDMCTHDLSAPMRGKHALVHLAFAVGKAQYAETSYRANNVQGTLQVLACAKALGLNKVVNLSSVSVYGQGLDLTEDAPLAPLPGFSYAQHKADIERWTHLHFPSVVHLRSHLIFGPNAQPLLRNMCHAPFYIRPPKPFPHLQVVHEADVAQAIILCLKHKAHGAYNLAAPPAICLPDWIKHRRPWVMPLPLWLAHRAASLAHHLGSRADFTWLNLMRTSLTVDCRRAQDELGWKPQFCAWQTRESLD